MTVDHQTECSHVQDLLDDFRRENLASADRQQVLAHLKQCDICAAELQFRQALSAHLRASLPPADALVALSPAVYEAIQAPRHKLAHNDRKMVLLPWMFAAAAIIIFAVAFFRNRPEEPFESRNTIAFDLPQASDSENLKMEQAKGAPAEADLVGEELADLKKDSLAEAAADNAPAEVAQPRAGETLSAEANLYVAATRPASVASTAALTSASIATTASQANTTVPLSQAQDRQNL